MKRSTVGILAPLALVVALTTIVEAQRFVPGTDPGRPRLKFADSLVSANDRCIVAQEKLNRRVRPVYVNGVPLGFC
jgi:hypothetical protein